MEKRTGMLSAISVYSVAHALVDATCAATLYAVIMLGHSDARDVFLLIVLYNILAFSTQALWGLLVDIFKIPMYAAVAGIALVAASTLLLHAPFPAAIVAGIGNALFHVGGGVICLNMASGKAAMPGVYVAPGALGLTIGILIGKGGHFIAWPFIALLTLAVLLILRLPKPEIRAPRPLRGNPTCFESVILLLLASIAIRGMVGLSLVLPWKSDTGLLFALTSAVVLGKAFGGILGDRFGWSRVAVSGLAVSAPLLAFFPHIPSIAITGAFLFNLSMPITLICLASLLPGKEGFAFGLTTLALIIGAFPTFTPLRVVMGRQIFLSIAILISITVLYSGLRLYQSQFSVSEPTRR